MRRTISGSLLVVAAVVGLWLIAPGRADKPDDVDKINKKIDAFSAEDGGKPWSLAALKDKKAVVIVFLSFDCPVSNSYSKTLADLHAKYREKDVHFVGVVAGEELTAA